MKILKLVQWILIAILAVPAMSSEMNGMKYGKYSLSQPFLYKNLSLFFIQSPGEDRAEEMLTLQEAIEREKVIVHETGSVNELSIENISDEPVFIQAGEIVKGGRQDRILRYDLIVRARSGQIPIESFCVESGRWSQRGDESAQNFESSEYMTVSPDVKLAVFGGNQSMVWDEVDNVQQRLGENVGEEVADMESPTSLQLTLENDNVKEMTQAYIDTMRSAAEKLPGIVGFVFAVNGEIVSADIYRSSLLFQSLWPKLLTACATEALAQYREGVEIRALSPAEVVKWLEKIEQGMESSENDTGRPNIKIRESDDGYLSETVDPHGSNQWIHKNFLAR